MSKRKSLTKLLGIATIVASLIPSYSNANHKNDKDFYRQRIERAQSLDLTLRTDTKIAYGEEPQTSTQIGGGFVIGKYIFSKDHVVSKQWINIPVMSQFGLRTRRIKLDRERVIEEMTFLDDIALYSVVEDKPRDIAIFDLSKTPKLCERYCNDFSLDDLLTENQLYKGMRVYWVGSPRDNPGFYRESHISILRRETDEDTEHQETYMINNHLIPGSSGKPIWHNDKIVGVADHYWQGLGGVTFMDEYIEEVKKYEQNE